MTTVITIIAMITIILMAPIETMTTIVVIAQSDYIAVSHLFYCLRL